MGKTKTPYNHESESTTEAVGITKKSVDKFNKVLDKLMEEQPPKLSMVVEVIEDGLSKRELAFFLTNRIMSDA